MARLRIVKRGHSLLAAAFVLLGVLLALYGVFALVWGGDSSSGPTYVKIAGGQLDARLAGGLSLALATVFLASGSRAARGPRHSGTNQHDHTKVKPGN
jgi:membrane protein implicated in regulation of membrane protease activity